ncbi:oxidoreductase [Actinomycetes bacterium KLBMP 9759]
MSASRWNVADMPAQDGRTVVITGANSGLGLVAARELAAAGAHVVMACRNVEKGEAAAATVAGSVEVRRLDLADLGSVHEFAASVTAPVDVLVNNAGVMAVPLGRTVDGFETHLGTNHLGHFALTGLLLDRVRDRVVTLTSALHRIGRIRLDDLNWERRRYDRWAAYSRSKLANLMFAYTLQRRLVAAGSTLRSIAAHPGYSATNLQSNSPVRAELLLMAFMNRFISQPAAAGALPLLHAATVTDLPGGSFIGPDGPGEAWGRPRPVGSSAQSHDRDLQDGLWRESESLTGLTVDVARMRT